MTTSGGLLRLGCISAQRCCFNGPFPGEVADREAPDRPDAVVLTTSALQGRRRISSGRRPPGRDGGAETDAAAKEGPLRRCRRSSGGPALGLRAETLMGKENWDLSRHDT